MREIVFIVGTAAFWTWELLSTKTLGKWKASYVFHSFLVLEKSNSDNIDAKTDTHTPLDALGDSFRIGEGTGNSSRLSWFCLR